MVDLSKVPHPTAGNENEEPQAFTAEAVFLVAKGQNGSWIALPSVPDQIETTREVNADDIYHAVVSIKRDVEAAHYAQASVMMQQKMVSQMAERAQNMQLAQELMSKR